MQYLSGILEHSSRKYSDQIAIEVPGVSKLSYRDLEKHCLSLQDQLLSNGLLKGDRIGIFAGKSQESTIAILATLGIRGVYVPTDATGPIKRACYIFEDCQAKAILADPAYVLDIQENLKYESTSYSLEGINLELILCETTQGKALSLPADLAYLLYTSGSTGVPKGVMITHRNALCFIEWCAQEFMIKQEDAFSSIAPFHFDLSIFDLYVPLLKGARLVLFNEKATKNPMLLANLIADNGINVVYATPTLLKLILNHGKCHLHDFTKLRLILFAGEVFPILHLKRLMELWPQATFYNLYGPTETNVVTWFKVPDNVNEDRTQAFPIGKSCSYALCKIWDEQIKEPVIGTTGELIVSGESVAAGYLNLPDKNKAAFFQNQGIRWYKTGDIVSVDEEYNFVFVGRKDRMLKKNAYRIELAEIESALYSHEYLKEVGVVSYLNKKEEIQIKAFIKLAQEGGNVTIMEIREHFLTLLPLYMMPDQFQIIDSFPKTSTQKIDYQELKNLYT